MTKIMKTTLFAHKGLLAALAIMAFSGSAQAQACYEYVQGDPAMACDGITGGNSADFASDCAYTPGEPVAVEVPCPGVWINLNATDRRNPTPTNHASTCAAQGLRAAAVSGQTCASGERRPVEGTSSGFINYRFGTWGQSVTGGTSTSSASIEAIISNGGIKEGCHLHGDCGLTVIEPVIADYCWGPGQERDYDETDIVVAYYCEQ